VPALLSTKSAPAQTPIWVTIEVIRLHPNSGFGGGVEFWTSLFKILRWRPLLLSFQPLFGQTAG
jgi:hypothetical protein